MISKGQLFGAKPHSEEQSDAADDLLSRVNAIFEEYDSELASEQFAKARELIVDPDTGTQISGSKGGAGDGGFRLPTASTGRPNSSHKQAKAVDVYDPDESLEDWLDDGVLERHGLYRESPADTIGWVHLTTRAPGSGRRTFKP